jgi:uncharacterized protein YgbK (DUF1537 family)
VGVALDKPITGGKQRASLEEGPIEVSREGDTIPEMDVLGLADDLTGALEVGAKFAAEGLETLVSTRPPAPPAQVLVVDIETRHVSPGEAAERTRAAAGGAPLTCKVIYKKTDSTLRGNIGAELGALVRAHPYSPLIYAPAYPALGRAVRRGHLYIEGMPIHESVFARDALNPVGDSDIVRVLRSQTDAPVFSIQAKELNHLKAGAIYVCDGESEAEIEQAAEAVTNGCRLAAGPGALAAAIARRTGAGRARVPSWPRIRSCLVISGSRHERSIEQVCNAGERGWPVVAPGAIPASGWAILEGNGVGVGPQVVDILARVELEALAIFGGDTAYGILQSIGASALRPIGEILTGVPVSKLEDRNLYFITKAGGFGPVDVLSALRGSLA